MTYLGRFGVGDAVPMSVSVVNQSGVPSDPDKAPLASIYRQDGTSIASYSLPLTDRPGHTFSQDLLLNSSYASSVSLKYHIAYSWDVASTTQHAFDSFEIIKYGTGQTKLGTVLHLRTLSRPGGKWVLIQHEDGQVRAGMKPYIP